MPFPQLRTSYGTNKGKTYRKKKMLPDLCAWIGKGKYLWWNAGTCSQVLLFHCDFLKVQTAVDLLGRVSPWVSWWTAMTELEEQQQEQEERPCGCCTEFSGWEQGREHRQSPAECQSRDRAEPPGKMGGYTTGSVDATCQSSASIIGLLGRKLPDTMWKVVLLQNNYAK